MKYSTDLIKAPRPQDDVYRGDVNTQGILDTVLYADPLSGYYTKEFAKTLKGKNLVATAQNIWDFLKTQIPYVLDKTGYQWIKSPGRLWKEKSGDCKSFSVFTASILKNLGIPYGYRFASYDKDDPNPTHVYVYILPGKGSVNEIIVDAVWTGPFNTEKKYLHKKDYPMAKTYYLGNTEKHTPGVLKINKPLDQLTEGELDLLLARQRLEIEKVNAARIGSPFIGKYDEALKVVNHCIRNVDNPDIIAGVGQSMMDAAGNNHHNRAVGGFLKKIGKGIKKVAKAVVKVATAPLRLIGKGIMEIYLPKSAIFFLYLFTPANTTLPTQMERKKKKAQRFKNMVVKGLGMKEKHFMAIIRNNLTKRFGKSPESFIQEKLKARVSGIGNPRAALHRVHGIGAIPAQQRQKLAPKVKPNYNSTFNVYIHGPEYYNSNDAKVGVVTDVISVAIKAIQWIVSKLGGKKAAGDDGDTSITASDFPDIERDAVDAVTIPESGSTAEGEPPAAAQKEETKPAKTSFFKKVANVFSNLSPTQVNTLKAVASDILAKKPPRAVIQTMLQQQTPWLNSSQQSAVIDQIDNGGESWDYDEANALGLEIKKDGMSNGSGGGVNTNNGGGAKGGFCSC